VRQGRKPVATAARSALVIFSILVVASSTSALADLGNPPPPPDAPPVTQPPVNTVRNTPAITSDFTRPTRPVDNCTRSPFGCDEFPLPQTSPPPASNADEVPSCRQPGLHDPQGTTRAVSTAVTADIAPGALRFRVEVEEGLSIDPDCFAAAAAAILNDGRGWAGDGTVSFAQVDNDSPDFRLILASPETTNELCYPAATAGKYSCRNQNKVVLNLTRWEAGTDEFNGELDRYRQYLINHEVGHLLGHGHRSCTQVGMPAPVMMQQTKGLGDCLPNGWPNEDER
jgi:hypothetical protein